MSSKSPMLAFLFLLLNLSFPVLSTVPNPDPATIQPFLPTRSPPATIPAFPEQSDFSGCSLDLPDELFPHIKSACGTINNHKHEAASNKLQRLHYSRCCPVLAAWLYAAYSNAALGRTSKVSPATTTASTTSYDMPQLPDDSETCVDNLEKAMKERKMELMRPNETCDVVYCYCGIRLHPLSCPGAFWVNEKGKMVGDERVKRLERNCLSSRSSSTNGGFPGLGGCSKCLHSLYQLHGEKSRNTSKSEDRTSKIHNTDCQLMGLTWLLAKNRTAYIHTVSSVLRAIMMSTDGSDPRSCTLNSDGMPLAVDSSEISEYSLATNLRSSIYLSFLSPPLLYMLHKVYGFP